MATLMAVVHLISVNQKGFSWRLRNEVMSQFKTAHFPDQQYFQSR